MDYQGFSWVLSQMVAAQVYHQHVWRVLAKGSRLTKLTPQHAVVPSPIHVGPPIKA